MQRLHGKDATWLAQETPTVPLHTIKIFEMEVPGGRIEHSLVKERFTQVLRKAPMLRQRVVPVPFGLHHPVMVNDPDFDLDMHINRAAVPAPGTRVELDDLIGQIISGSLDRSRPLWELWVIEGYGKDKLVLALKIHHLLADGMATVGFIQRVFDGEYIDESRDPWRPEELPSKKRLVADAILDHLKYDIPNFPRMVSVMIKRFVRLFRYARHKKAPMVEALQTDLPRTCLNAALSNKRNYASLQLSLPETKALKNRLGGTLNDVFLALAASTIRKYLIHRDDLPGAPLSAAVPMAIDEKGTVREFGNNFMAMVTMIPVNIEDDLQRFRETQSIVAAAKEELYVLGPDTWNRINHYVPPGLITSMKMRTYRKQVAARADYVPDNNLLLSNVPGPQKKLGAMSSLFSVGPLNEGMGLNITVWSYADQLNISFLACKRLVPDLRRMVEMMQESLQELYALADRLEADERASRAEVVDINDSSARSA